MTTRTFTAEWLDAHSIDNPFVGKMVVHREFVENQEYGTVWKAVFSHDGKHWQITYQTPLGEADADTWFDEREVKATEVCPRGTFVTSWVPVHRVTAGTCTANANGVCGREAPFLVALRSGETGIKTVERCARHLRAMFMSAEGTEAIQEVRRRWH